jgi:hypothetical protein
VLQYQAILLLSVEFEAIGFATVVSAHTIKLIRYDLRHYKSVLVGGEEVQLQRVPDATGPVDRCQICHADESNSFKHKSAVIK